MARVLVAMSGGVDSSVAAALLREQGYEVLGVTLRLLDMPEASGEESGCCSLDAVRRAQAVCRQLGIPHYTFNFVSIFEREVIAPFVADYASGRTPNPCLRCNMEVKWGELLRRARGAGCEFLATGHYARRRDEAGRRQLLRGADPTKDQSYALYGLSQPALAATLLPLGELTKSEVRARAAELSLPTADTAESQDICFIPAGDYRDFLRERLPFRPGPVVDETGAVLGEHQGLPGYTLGQRKGLGIGGGEPLFVVAKDLPGNRLVVGRRAGAAQREVHVEQVNWLSQEPPPPGEALPAEVELRYRGVPVPAQMTALPGDRALLHLAPHEQAVVPGQAAVWYRGDLLLGGGLISLPDPPTEGICPHE
ncbi:MAG TPA: tRNA 2-thiouridine(34) synthase MnmA [Armatimonadota bacterium]|jgi:tRNA-specific 2-thiouridylase